MNKETVGQNSPGIYLVTSTTGIQYVSRWCVSLSLSVILGKMQWTQSVP